MLVLCPLYVYYLPYIILQLSCLGQYFLYHALFFLSLEYCHATGDGDAYALAFVPYLLAFFAGSGKNPNYSIEFFKLTILLATVSEEERERILFDRWVNTRGGRYGNIPIDKHVEHVNRVIKRLVKKIGVGAKTLSLILRISRSADVIEMITDAVKQLLRLSSPNRHKRALYEVTCNVKPLLNI